MEGRERQVGDQVLVKCKIIEIRQDKDGYSYKVGMTETSMNNMLILSSDIANLPILQPEQ